MPRVMSQHRRKRQGESHQSNYYCFNAKKFHKFSGNIANSFANCESMDANLGVIEIRELDVQIGNFQLIFGLRILIINIMQKKHLHTHLTILLLLILAGCGSNQKPPENPYISGDKQLNIEYTVDNQHIACWGNLTAIIDGSLNSQDISLRCEYEGGLSVDLNLTGPGGTAGSGGDSIIIRRSLMSLAVTRVDGPTILEMIPSPSGDGFSVHCAEVDEPGWSLSLSLSDNTNWPLETDSEESSPGISPAWVSAEGGIWVWPDTEHRNPCIGVSPAIEDLNQVTDSEGYIRVPVSAKRGLQINFAFADSHEESIKRVRASLGKDPDKILESAIADLNKQIAFGIVTEDDRANQAIALLQSRLNGAGKQVQVTDPHQIADMANQAVGLFLNSRTRPAVVFPGDDKRLDEALSRVVENDRIFWAANAVRAVLSYGIVQDEALTQFQSGVAAALSRLDAEYTADGRVILDPGIQDSLLRTAVSLIRYADLMRLGEEISNQRGQTTPAGFFRTKSMAASRKAQSNFEMYNRLHVNYQRWSVNISPKTDDEIDPLELYAAESRDTPPEVPDTLAWVLTGARYGFTYLANDPKNLMGRLQSLSPFVWQRWLRYRFESAPQLTETSDFDSLMTLLLTGPLPGAVVDRKSAFPDSDLLASANALQNISEIYLGVRPDWAAHKLEIAPRLPNGWGRTSARIPMGSGFLLVDYNFVKETATFRIEGITTELDVIFRYPLPSGKTLSAQFKLAAERPEVSTYITRDRGNLMHIEVE
jgi:hypothetical protein